MKCVKKKTINLDPFSIDIYEPDFGSKFFRVGLLLPFSSLSSRLPNLGPKWLDDIKKELLGSAARMEKAMKTSTKHLGWVPVVETGRRGAKTTQCNVICDLYASGPKYWGMEPPAVVGKKFSCWVSTSLLEKSSLGEAFAPTWVVAKNFEKKTGDRYHKAPSERNVWPDFLQNEWVDLHLNQLPDKEQVLKEARRAKAKARRAKAAWEKRENREREEREARKAAEAAAAAESERRREAAKQKRFATLPQESNVSVKWKEWSRINGRYVAEEMQADGVDLIFAGKRTYIIFPDGDEIIKKSDNVVIVNAQAT